MTNVLTFPKPARRQAERVKLTSTRIEKMQATSKRQRIADSEVVGLHLVIRTSGAKSFVVRGRVGGSRTRPVIDVTVGPTSTVTLAEARAEAKAILARMRLGEDPRGKRAVDASVADVVAMFLDHKRQSGVARLDNIKRSLARATKGLGQQPAHLVSKKRWAEQIDKIHTAKGHNTACDALKFLKSMANWAESRDIFNAGEILRVAKPVAGRTEEIAREQRKAHLWTLRQAQWPAFWAATSESPDPVFRDLLRCLALSGLRRGEIAKARWADIDLDEGIWTIPASNTKTVAAHAVVIGPLLREVLEGRVGGDLVFAGRGGAVISGWSQRIKSVPLPRLQLHGLRRGYRTALSELRVPTDIAEMMIAHKRSGLIATYDKSMLMEERREAQLKLEAAWMEVIHGS